MLSCRQKKRRQKIAVETIVLGDNKNILFSHAKKIDVGTGYLIFVYGVQCPKDAITDDVAQQTHLVFQDIEKILSSAGATFDNVIKAVIYLTDMKDFDIVSPIRAEYFKNSMPVSTLVEVNGMTRSSSKIEVEVTAFLEK